MSEVEESTSKTAEITPSRKLKEGTTKRPVFVDRDRLMKSYACELCNQIVVKPCQTPCGYRICRKCIDAKFGNDTKITCPLSHADLDEEELADRPCKEGLIYDSVFGDPGTEKDLLNEKCFCTNEPYGCSAKIAWKNMEKHLHECKFTSQQCLNAKCRERFLNQGTLEHLENCLDSLIPCSLCSEPVKHRDIQDHERKCQLENCKLCKKKCGSLEKLMVHRRTYAPCISKGGKCYYYKYCKFEASTVEELREHMENDKDLHIEMLTAEVGQLELKLS